MLFLRRAYERRPNFSYRLSLERALAVLSSFHRPSLKVFLQFFYFILI